MIGANGQERSKRSAQEIAEGGTILRATVGSTLHGLSLKGTDDTDEMGVCIEPPDCVIGLGQFEQWVSRTQPEGQPSGPGDLDLTIYSLRKWVRLALAGNPTVLLLLFAPVSQCRVRTEEGAELQALAPAFIARSVSGPFLGYLVAQRQRLTGERGGRALRKSHKFEHLTADYDTKYAMHMLRLGFQGVELLETGALTLPMPVAARDLIMAVRRGEVKLNDVLTKVGELERRIADLADASPLPATPDQERVESWMIRTYLDHPAWR
jgi:predicted nucleotidyltransferase